MTKTAPRAWKPCSGCGTFEWNDVLTTRRCVCSRWNRTVKLYKPKGKKDGDDSTDQGANQLRLALTDSGKGQGKGYGGGKGSDGDASSEVKTRLLRIINSTKDMGLKAQLLAELEAADRPGPAVQVQTPEETLRRAAGEWKNANMRHDQAVAQVIKCRSALAKAEEKEMQMAKELAAAELSKKVAVRALAVAAGVSQEAQPGAAGPGKDGTPSWTLTWDEAFFSKLEEYECEPQEREELRKLEGELRSARESITSKGSQVEEGKQKMAAMQQEITMRMAKKRRAEQGGAVAGGGGSAQPSGGTASGPTGGPAPAEAPKVVPTEDEIEKEAQRLSAAKFEAAQQAAQLVPAELHEAEEQQGAAGAAGEDVERYGENGGDGGAGTAGAGRAEEGGRLQQMMGITSLHIKQ
ncbi:unnamed protein product [Prorocentrum cordatum]|uniref:Uncharacterized protein n=1 Tax=Prorocentrum cordatum TaxID=2364126 RepID=A0ABN9SAV1_9DINO|nr:unnamed protein product [Polarella glacialis]